MKQKLLGAAVVAVLLLGGSSLVPPAGAQENEPGNGELEGVLPMIFVHGFMGSGQQFEAQALRFASNGYPADHIDMFEHDSLTWPRTIPDPAEDPEGAAAAEAYREEVWGRLDSQIDDMLAASGAEQIYLLGHSQGTAFSLSYLDSSTERAARVAKYVNFDGSHGSPAPTGVETLGIWGESLTNGDRELTGATNVVFEDQAHTQVVNSPESFTEIYKFFTGEEPFTTGVVREPAGEIVVGGRVQLFPENAGAEGATLRIFEVDGETGLRLSDEPEATFELNGNGDWGPFEAGDEAFYEFAITRPDSESTHHVYPQRFVRSNPWMRVLTSEPGGVADSFWEFSDDHANIVVTRNKEWWGDQGADSDVLEVNGQSILDATSPRSNRTIGIFIHDFEVDEQSDLTEPVIPYGFGGLDLFLTGVDLFVPAADPPDGTVAVVATPRLGDGPEAVCVPNYASTTHRSSIQFGSYHHMVNSDGSPAEGHADPECAPAAERPDVVPPAAPVTGTPGFTG